MTKILILGLGYGGNKILHTLISLGLPENLEITVVDRIPFHTLKTEFYAVAAGTVQDAHINMIPPQHPQIKYVINEVQSLDLHAQQVMIENTALSYDYLVIGLGCEDNYRGIPGAAEYTHSLQTFGKAKKTYENISQLAKDSVVTVIGGGLSGVEFASELRECRPDLQIGILERGDTVLSPFSKKIQQYATKWFESHGVEIYTNTHLEEIKKGIVVCKECNIHTDAIIWAAGVKPNQLLDCLELDTDKNQRIKLNEFYQIPKYPNVYVVGDCASLPHPPSAQLAEAQGEQIAALLKEEWENKTLTVPSEFKLNGTLGSLGKSDGFGVIYNKNFTGFIPRKLKSGLLWAHQHRLH